MAFPIIVGERRRRGKRRIRLDLSNGMRIAALTNVTDESRTMLRDGLATTPLPAPRARTNDASVISAPPFTL